MAGSVNRHRARPVLRIFYVPSAQEAQQKDCDFIGNCWISQKCVAETNRSISNADILTQRN
jgi:hypothetical protein